MIEGDFSKYKTPFTSLAVVAVIIQTLGSFELGARPFSGFTADDNSTITNVVPESPAHKAGIQVGDKMRMNAGIDTKDFRALLRLPRARIGETRRFVFERNGNTFSVDLTFEGLPQKEVVLAVLYAIMGFCFLGFGMWAYFTVSNTATALLALVCFSAAIDFISHPHVPSYNLRLIYMCILNIIVFLGYAFLLHLLMTFPKPKRLLAKRYGMVLVYGPAILMSVVLLALAIVQPDRTEWLFVLARAVYALLFIGYLGFAVTALVHSVVKATSAERAEHGLSLVLYSTIIGIAPSIIAGTMKSIAPTVALPASAYYMFSAVLIPISLAFATTKTHTTPSLSYA